ncbi:MULTISPECIES: terminase small subunit [Clostridium]|uniref:Phage terminase family protein n=2 Tax=Clostridium TaxID=1485 RepID=A0Q0V1_CLONN|nr:MULTISPECIES: terminase small subunit [Clostridium]ABK61622.1 phage terminase family protein [Clostridium novyi NT]KEH88624.1 terminase [Clostridium novyi A str. NCTC 538]KEH89137.1 terminase [Clostridium novyi A str. BKT29909]KEI15450.1 terminase [Clostridium haemolyticum NCTC 9693]
MKLTPKQKAFADYYIQLGNATEAAIKAGYNKKTARQIGSMNLTKVDIKNYIQERMTQLEDKRIAKAEEVLQYLTRVVRGEENEPLAVQEQEPVIGEDGKKKGYRTVTKVINIGPNIKDRNKAAELLGKRYRLFTEKVEVEGNVGIEIVDDIDE